MKINRLILLIAMIVNGIGFFCLLPAMAQDLSPSQAYDQKSLWFTYEPGGEAGWLAEKAVMSSDGDASSLSIVDSMGRESKDLQIPSGAWVQMQLVAGESGELELFCRYPTGSVAALYNSSVQSGRAYTTWYQAGLEGDYELWFAVGGSKSNSIKIQVSESAEEWESAPGAAAGGGVSRATAMAPAVLYSVAPQAAEAGPIGLSAGGAKDVNSFRENILQDYLPLPSDLTYEGLFYDYYFDTGAGQECKKLFCPTYCYATSRDPISSEMQYYLTVGLNSGITDFQRKKLNLVIVLDYSGSMGSPFDEYYYDRFGNLVEPKVGDAEEGDMERGKTKMQIADESVVALLGHLKQQDRFGLVIFSDDAFLVDPLTAVGDKDLERLKSRILEIKDYSGTNMEAGMEKGTALFDRLLKANKSEYENRIIFLTDAMPNIGETGDLGLYRMLEDNADRGIYTTFIGIGLDFNSQLAESITKVKGANYYSVHSSSEFLQRMDDEFDFMVTPLVFDLRLHLEAPGYEIEKVYGSPEADLATGELMAVNTLFPSKSEEGEVKGGVILVKLRKLSDDGNLIVKASYQDREGRSDSDEAVVEIPGSSSDFYENSGIRKAILLTRYADLLKNWMIDERRAAKEGWQIVPSVTAFSGIVVPVELGEWERQSMPLAVAEQYRQLFGLFEGYMQTEMQAIGDDTLQQEVEILEKLQGYQGDEAGRLRK